VSSACGAFPSSRPSGRRSEATGNDDLPLAFAADQKGILPDRMIAALARDGAIRRADATGTDPDELAREVMRALGGPVR
jgi:hypothetical protein